MAVNYKNHLTKTAYVLMYSYNSNLGVNVMQMPSSKINNISRFNTWLTLDSVAKFVALHFPNGASANSFELDAFVQELVLIQNATKASQMLIQFNNPIYAREINVFCSDEKVVNALESFYYGVYCDTEGYQLYSPLAAQLYGITTAQQKVEEFVSSASGPDSLAVINNIAQLWWD